MVLSAVPSELPANYHVGFATFTVPESSTMSSPRRIELPPAQEMRNLRQSRTDHRNTGSTCCPSVASDRSGVQAAATISCPGAVAGKDPEAAIFLIGSAHETGRVAVVLEAGI